MKNFSKTLTIEEGTKLYKSIGMVFVDTKHNRCIMKQVVDNHLKELQSK